MKEGYEMAPESIESIKGLFDDAEHDGKRIEYLFKLIFKSSEDTKESLKVITGEIKKMQAKCDMRKVVCDENFAKKKCLTDVKNEANGFITKKQAKIYGFIFMAFAIGIGVGTGVITWSELAKRAIP